MPAEPDENFDSESVRTWLTALDLLLAAEDAARGASRIRLGIAVVLADAAVEASLGIIASHGEKDVPEKADYAALWQLALERRPLNQSLRDRLRRLHRQRNLVLHLGGTVDEHIASAGTKAARALFNELAPEMTGTESLPAGTGPATAVGTLLESYAPEIAHALTDMDAKLSQRAWKEACQAAAYALDMARARCDPPLLWTQARGPTDPFNHSRYEDDERRREQETLLVANGLGVTVSDYLRLREVIGRTSSLRHEYPPHFYGGPDDPDPDDVRHATAQVVEIIFRLWETGVMKSGTTPVYLMMAARGLIPDAFG